MDSARHQPAAALLLVERHLGPRLLSHDERVGSDADLAAERPIKRDYQHHDQRERGRESAGHRQMHPEVLVAEEVGEAGSDRRAEEYDPPDHAGNMPLDSGEAAAARLVELVPSLEQLSLDHRFTEVLGLDGCDRSIELTQRFPSLVGCFASPLDRPFLVDNNADVPGYRIADWLALGLR